MSEWNDDLAQRLRSFDTAHPPDSAARERLEARMLAAFDTAADTPPVEGSVTEISLEENHDTSGQRPRRGTRVLLLAAVFMVIAGFAIWALRPSDESGVRFATETTEVVARAFNEELDVWCDLSLDRLTTAVERHQSSAAARYENLVLVMQESEQAIQDLSDFIDATDGGDAFAPDVETLQAASAAARRELTARSQGANDDVLNVVGSLNETLGRLGGGDACSLPAISN